MPELPEVETIVRSLEGKIVNHRIRRVEVLSEKAVKTPEIGLFVARLEGQRITGVGRRGKHLLIRIGSSWVLVIHLRMTGRLIYTEADSPSDRYTHVIFQLDNGGEIRFHDVRRFGTIHLLTNEEAERFPSLCSLGPDALDPELTRDAFKKRLKGRRGQIKKILLDQSFVTGIGNIYANEILWKARVHPERTVDSLSSREQGMIYRAMREVLSLAVAHRGTTLRDYVDGEGVPGEFQGLLAVHGREGAPCPSCKKPIVRAKIGGRSAFFCPFCQK
ncbi:MAG: formamidopyrimidine-DNA glycosylase [Clostridia bacterium]|nr:formamidopyrimidine-DNA glycosylase [Clostridia bacterium]